MTPFDKWLSHPLTTPASLVKAIVAERQESERPLFAEVVEVKTPDNFSFVLFCNPDSLRLVSPGGQTQRAILTEDLEGSEISESSSSWTGKVTAVHIEACVIIVEIDNRDSVETGQVYSVPQAGDRIKIEAKQYLVRLEKLARSLPSEAHRPFALQSVGPEPKPVVPAVWKWGRPSQVASLSKPKLFVWGPPGTGKTTAAGWRVAQNLLQGNTVICLAPTHVAVDRLTLSIDTAWRELSGRSEPGFILRAGEPKVDELANDPTRSHLLLWSQTYLHYNLLIRDCLDRLEQVGKSLRVGPSASLENQRRDLVEELSSLRKQRASAISKLVINCQCLIVNTCMWTYHDSMRERCWNLALFDEASMISMAYPFLLAEANPDNRPLFFAFYGDFLQFKPISVSSFLESAHTRQGSKNDRVSEHWLATSPFCAIDCERSVENLINTEVVHMLEEQSRMTQIISDEVSRRWYLGRLKSVNAPAPLTAANRMPGGPIVWIKPSECTGIPANCRDSPPYSQKGGNSYKRSAWISAQAVERLLVDRPGKSIALIVPFKEQLSYVNGMLRPDIISQITLGTVHRMQGSEADIVIIDLVNPINGSVRFFGERLARVAITRCRQQLIIIAEQTALANHHYKWFLENSVSWAPDLSP